MNQKRIFDAVKASQLFKGNDFKITQVEDHLVFKQQLEYIECNSKFRCQSFGSMHFLTPNGNSILNKALNASFENLIISDLRFKLDTDKTIVRASGHFKTSELFDDFRIVSEEDIIKVTTFINSYLKEVQELFFIPALEIVNIGRLIAVNDFKDQNKVLVGGKFPVHIMKKMFFLKIGGQEERFKEYKAGLESLLRLYEERKPDKKEEVKLFWEGYNYFIENLESAPTPPSA